MQFKSAVADSSFVVDAALWVDKVVGDVADALAERIDKMDVFVDALDEHLNVVFRNHKRTISSTLENQDESC